MIKRLVLAMAVFLMLTGTVAAGIMGTDCGLGKQECVDILD